MTGAGEVQLDLQDGFVHDEVVVSVNGREIARLADVTTRTQISLARSVPLPTGPGAVRLVVAVPALGLAQEMELPPIRPLWIGVSLNNARNKLESRLQTERFGYA